MTVGEGCQVALSDRSPKTVTLVSHPRCSQGSGILQDLRSGLSRLSDPRGAGGSDEMRRGLCYDEHHIWRVMVVVTRPETRPCVFRGEVGPVGKDRSSPALWRHSQRYGLWRCLCRS